MRLNLPEGFPNRGGRRPLGVADRLIAATALPVRAGDLVCEVDDEALVLVELLRCRLAFEQSDGVAWMPQKSPSRFGL